jgi:hypothetical protein
VCSTIKNCGNVVNQLVYVITAVVALPFATLLVLACLSEIEALRCWIRRSPNHNIGERPERPSRPRLMAAAIARHFSISAPKPSPRDSLGQG